MFSLAGAHILHATGQHDRAVSRLDALGGQGHGSQAGPAHHVDTHGGDTVREPGILASLDSLSVKCQSVSQSIHVHCFYPWQGAQHSCWSR